ncbi:uncharacterized protein LOC136024784 [Artemia franciscana]|nr:DNA repair protein Rad51-like protein [Artemia sp.]
MQSLRFRSLEDTINEEIKTRPLTGRTHVDSFLHQVVIPGHITEVYGEAGAGKSQLCIHLSALSCINNNKVYFIDTEGKFRIDRLLEIMMKIVQPDLDDIKKHLHHFHYFRAKTPLMLEEILKNILKQQIRSEDIVIIDSIAGASRFYFDAFQELKLHLLKVRSRLQTLAGLCLVPVVATNQIAADITSSAEQAALFSAWGKDSNLSFRMTTNRDSSDGSVHKMIMEKMNIPYRQAEVSNLDYYITSAGISHANCNC